MDSIAANYRSLLEAISFAGRAHHGQVRKDGRTPYAAHVFRVCLIVRHVFGIDDPTALAAAVLHDTIEDTTTDFDDLEERFGAEVASWVALLSKDTRLRDDEREAAYRANLSRGPWQVKVCKLADVFDNLLDSVSLPADKRHKPIERARSYLAVLDDPTLPEPARRAYDLVRRLVDETAGATV